MDLKLIPRESPIINFQVNPIRKDQKNFLSILKFIKNKVKKNEISPDDKIIRQTTEKLINLLEKPRNFGSLELGNLVNYLYRTILTLQRKKNNLLNQENKKRKRK